MTDPFSMLSAGAMLLAAALSGIDGYREGRIDHGLFSLFCFVAAGLLLVEGAPALIAAYVGEALRNEVGGVLRLGFALALPGFIVSQFRGRYGLFWIGGLLLILAAVGMLLPGQFALAASLAAILGGLVTGYGPMNEGERGAAPLFVALLVAGIDYLTGRASFMAEDWPIYLPLISLLAVVAYFNQRTVEKNARARALEAAARMEGEIGGDGQGSIARRWLGTMSDWVEGDPGVAAWFLQTAAQEVRQMVALLKKPVAPLAEEIGLCRRYLAILSKRQQRDFALATELEENSLATAAPTGILHPLLDLVFDRQQVRADTQLGLTLEQSGAATQVTFSAPIAPILRAEMAGNGVEETLEQIASRLAASGAEDAALNHERDTLRWQCMIRYRLPETALDEQELGERTGNKKGSSE